MAGDIEEFLRLAAERRRAKQQKKREQPAAATPPVNRLRVSQPLEEEVIDAEPVTGDDVAADVARHLDTRDFAERTSHLGEGVAKEAAQIQERVQQQFTHKVTSQPETRGDKGAKKLTDDASIVESVPNNDATLAEVIASLRSPRTLKQALLLKEIFSRPESNWE